MPDLTVRQFQSRFVFHLIGALRGRLVFGGIPFAANCEPLAAHFGRAQLSVPAIWEAKDELMEEWLQQQLDPSRPAQEVWDAIAKSVQNLSEAIDQTVADASDQERFVGAVFRCRDQIMLLDVLLRTT